LTEFFGHGHGHGHGHVDDHDYVHVRDTEVMCRPLSSNPARSFKVLSPE
jgi:hypothetical protein